MRLSSTISPRAIATTRKNNIGPDDLPRDISRDAGRIRAVCPMGRAAAASSAFLPVEFSTKSWTYPATGLRVALGGEYLDTLTPTNRFG